MPDNSERASFAEAAVEAFRQRCGTDRVDAIGDLICNLCHLSDVDGVDAIANVRNGLSHYYAETHGEKMANVVVELVPQNEPKGKRRRRKPDAQAALSRIVGLTLGDCLRFFDSKATKRDHEIVKMVETRDEEFECDNDLTSEGDDNGAYVLGWRWVPFAGTKFDKEKE